MVDLDSDDVRASCTIIHRRHFMDAEGRRQQCMVLSVNTLYVLL